MAISYVSGSFNSKTGSNAATDSLTIDAGVGQDRLVVGMVLFRSTPMRTVTSATYGGEAMTVLTPSATNGALCAVLMYLADAPSGSNSLVVNFSGNPSQYALKGAAWVGVDPDSPLDQQNTGTGNSGTPSASVTTTEDGELVVAAIIHESATALSSDGQTPLDNADHGAWVSSSSYTVKATAGEQTMAWTGAGDTYAMAVAGFKEAADANTVPTIELDTADESTLGATPTLAFTGTDAQSDDIRYQVQISDTPDFVGGVILRDNDTASASGGFHSNGIASPLTWDGEYQVDDRFGHTFVAYGGVLDKAVTSVETDTTDTDGTAVARVYAIEGTPGVDAAPLNAATYDNTPTPGWLAESDPLTFTYPFAKDDYEFVFSGANRIRLTPGGDYMVIWDWRPTTGTYDNLIELSSIIGSTHPGNTYVDGYSSANNGVFSGAGLNFAIYEENVLIDALSGTDAGFDGDPDDTDPYASGQQVTYTVQAGDELVDGVTYYWRVRATDPSGTATWSDWSEVREFTVATGGSGDDDLTADGITTGAPAIGSAALSEAEGLGASGLTTGAPAIGSGGLGEAESLAASGLATGAPSVGSAAIGEAEALAANGLTSEAPTLSDAALDQERALSASGPTVGEPVIGSGAIAETEGLAADGLTVGAPALSAVTIGSIENTVNLTADGITGGAPVIGSAELGQAHALSATGLVGGSAALSDAELGQTRSLGADGLVGGSVALTAAAVGETETLGADGLTAGAPALTAVSLTQASNTDPLSADGLTAGAPTLSSAGLGETETLGASAIVASGPVLSGAAIGETEGLGASGLTTGAPEVGAAFMGTIFNLTADGLATGGPVIGSAALGQNRHMTVANLWTEQPVIGGAAVGETEGLLAGALATGAPALSAVAILLGVLAIPSSRMGIVAAENRIGIVA